VLKSYTIEVRYLIDRLDLYEKGLVRTQACRSQSDEGQDLMPAQDGVDLDHMHYSLQILSAIILNSPEDRITMAEDHIGFSEALLATILVAVPMALTSEKAIAQLGILYTPQHLAPS